MAPGVLTPEASHVDYEHAMGEWGKEAEPSDLDTVDIHKADELTTMGAKTFVGTGLGKDGMPSTYGGAVKPDRNIIGMYSGVKGKSKDFMLTALANGGNKLDAYAVDNASGEPDTLAHIYHKTGFEPVARVKFDPAYAKPGFEQRQGGGKDIVFYKHNGDTPGQVAAKYGTYPPPTKAQYDELPVMGYDEAAKYRDSLIK